MFLHHKKCVNNIINMIHHKDFPFDTVEEREIVHINLRTAQGKKMGIRIVLLSFTFASIMFGAKYMYDIGRGTPDFAQAPLVVAKKEPYRFTPKDAGGMKIPYMDKEIYKNLDPAYIDENEVVKPIAGAEKPMKIDELANMIENNFSLDDGPAFIGDFVDKFQDEPALDKNFDISNNENSDTIKIPEMPLAKPKSFKLTADGHLNEKIGSQVAAKPAGVLGAKKIDITKILAKKNEAEIWVQLGTFANEQEATKAWQNVSEKNADVLGNNKIKITKSDLGDKGIFYRLQSGPFESESQARSICKTMNDRDQNCFFVKQDPKI